MLGIRFLSTKTRQLEIAAIHTNSAFADCSISQLTQIQNLTPQPLPDQGRGVSPSSKKRVGEWLECRAPNCKSPYRDALAKRFISKVARSAGQFGVTTNRFATCVGRFSLCSRDFQSPDAFYS